MNYIKSPATPSEEPKLFMKSPCQTFCKDNNIFEPSKQYERKIKTWIFNIRMKRAIRRADKLANQLRCKVIILNINGKPVITTMQRIRGLIKEKTIKGTFETPVM